MGAVTNVLDHIKKKEELFYKLQQKGFMPNNPIMLYVVVNTLPYTWPIDIIKKKFENDFIDMIELEKTLTDIEIDILSSRALEDMEAQLNIQWTRPT